MSDNVKVPQSLYSWISPEDPFRIGKCYHIKQWWLNFFDLYYKCNLENLARVFRSEDCWRRVNNLHGVKLDRKVVGERLYVARSNYSFEKKFKLACRYCLENEIATLFHNRRKTTSFHDLCYLLEVTKSNSEEGDNLVAFWLYFLEGRIRCLNTDLHVLEYGFQCALDMKQPQAMEYFWSNIIALPENEMSTQKKDEIIMYCAVYSAQACYSLPEILVFAFSQMKPEKYSEFLEKEFRESNRYWSLSTLLHAHYFEEFKALFDCLMPNQISMYLYCNWIYNLEMNRLSGRYMDGAVSVFMHMWEKSGFDEHRSQVHTELAINTWFQTSLLVPLFSKGYTNLVWTILDCASPGQIEQYMDSTNSDLIVDLLLQMKDYNSLYKFLTYQCRSAL